MLKLKDKLKRNIQIITKEENNMRNNEDYLMVWYCKECGWKREYDTFVVCVNQCPNCLDKNLNYVNGRIEEVKKFFLKKKYDEEQEEELLKNPKPVQKWPKRLI